MRGARGPSSRSRRLTEMCYNKKKPKSFCEVLCIMQLDIPGSVLRLTVACMGSFESFQTSGTNVSYNILQCVALMLTVRLDNL